MELESINENYRGICGDSMPRLLALLDREPSSRTYGCFHRSFWLHRTSDFASSAAQQGLLALALWREEKGELDALIIAALRFTLNLQHRDGSYDE